MNFTLILEIAAGIILAKIAVAAFQAIVHTLAEMGRETKQDDLDVEGQATRAARRTIPSPK